MVKQVFVTGHKSSLNPFNNLHLMKKSDRPATSYQALLHTMSLMNISARLQRKETAVTYNEEWEAQSERLEIKQSIAQVDFGTEQDLPESETSAEYDEYSPSIIDEYFARTPRMAR